MDQSKTTWDGITEEVIGRELRKFYVREPRATHAWLVPCTYEDGEKTVSASLDMPYSNPNRRIYSRSRVQEFYQQIY